jgi:hypothetical protein
MVPEEADQSFGATVVNFEVKVGAYHALTGFCNGAGIRRNVPKGLQNKAPVSRCLN